MGKILYLECNSGISGDMTVGALLDLGADRKVLEEKLASLGVGGYHLHFGRSNQYGLDAYDFDVHLEEECGADEGHSHGHEGHVHEHSHGEDESHVHERSHGERMGQAHEHSHGEDKSHVHEHSHGDHEFQVHTHSHETREGHTHTHSHPHVHRNLSDIYTIIDRLDSDISVRNLAKKMFLIVAEAEAKAHGLPMDEVHFHEVGAIDSIVDILSVAICLDNLGIHEVVVSALTEGHGYVRCQHGLIPIPVPATANIAAAHGLTFHLTDQEGEMVTPTGAAIAAALRTMEKLPDSCRIIRTGMGAGKRDFGRPNVLRAMILETSEEAAAKSADESPSSPAADSQMWVLETNIDDCSGENLGFVMESLLEEGAADVWSTPIFMKKNRPAYQLSVLCRAQEIKNFEELILTQTTTIGVRRYPVMRTVLGRKSVTVETRYGEAAVKVCTRKDQTFYYPEYESVRSICRNHNINFQEAYCAVREAAAASVKGDQGR